MEKDIGAEKGMIGMAFVDEATNDEPKGAYTGPLKF